MIPSDGYGPGVGLDTSDKNVSGENFDTADVWHCSLHWSKKWYGSEIKCVIKEMMNK